MNTATAHHYRRFRAHQMATWSRDSNSGGSAWPGSHAIAAYNSARSHLHFMERMKEYTKPTPKRRGRNRQQ
jgi:hypothetical protein